MGLALLALTVAGCTGEGAPTPVPSSSSTGTTSPSPSPTDPLAACPEADRTYLVGEEQSAQDLIYSYAVGRFGADGAFSTTTSTELDPPVTPGVEPAGLQPHLEEVLEAALAHDDRLADVPGRSGPPTDLRAETPPPADDSPILVYDGAVRVVLPVEARCGGTVVTTGRVTTWRGSQAGALDCADPPEGDTMATKAFALCP